jgi:dihydrolipoamide dehydrogenase
MKTIGIIGAGIAGYTAAITSRRSGHKVTLIEKNKIGGVCLHAGCIPTKYLNSVIGEKSTTHQFAAYQKQKKQMIKILEQNILRLIHQHDITYIHGEARAVSNHDIEVTTKDGKSTRLSFDQIIVATGSIAKASSTKGKQITIDQLLDMHIPPDKLTIMGGGVVGCELASIFSRLGVQVTIVESQPNILTNFDESVSKFFSDYFYREGIRVVTNQKDHLKISGHYIDAIGRCRDLTSVQTNTAKKALNIRYIGDARGDTYTAAMSFQDGIHIEENTLKSKEDINPLWIAAYFEGVTIGQTEQSLRNSGKSYFCIILPMSVNGRNVIENTAKGFLKIIISKNRQIIGIHSVGSHVTDFIPFSQLLILKKCTIDEIPRIPFAHPTVSEIFLEAALAFDKRSIHFFHT